MLAGSTEDIQGFLLSEVWC